MPLSHIYSHRRLMASRSKREGMTMPNDIRDATMRRCIEEQDEARQAAACAAEYLQRGLLGGAAAFQRDAAYHHKQMWERLDQLIGV
jgi:hypothetical protein